MASKTNPICAKCPMAHERINGRFCTQLGKLVEYDPAPRCRPPKKYP